MPRRGGLLQEISDLNRGARKATIQAPRASPRPSENQVPAGGLLPRTGRLPVSRTLQSHSPDPPLTSRGANAEVTTSASTATLIRAGRVCIDPPKLCAATPTGAVPKGAAPKSAAQNSATAYSATPSAATPNTATPNSATPSSAPLPWTTPSSAPPPWTTPSSAPPPWTTPRASTRKVTDQEAEKISKVIEVFRRFDVNNDRMMDRTELSRLLWYLDPSFTDEELDNIMRHADKNGDGLIQYEEFVIWACSDNGNLSLKSVGVTESSVSLNIFMTDGKTCVLKASLKDRVEDLRFRACHGLKLGIASFPFLRLRAKSENVNLADALPVSELQEFDLQAIFNYTGSLLGASGNQIGVWQADNLELKMTIEAGEEVRHLLLCRESKVICACVGKSTISTWNLETGEHIWKTSQSLVSAMCSSQTDIYLCSEDNKILALDAKTGKHVWKGKVEKDFVLVLACLNCSGVVCAGTRSGKIFGWCSRTGKELWNVEHSTGRNEVWFLIGHRTSEAANANVFFSGGGGRVTAWNAKTGEQAWTTKLSLAAHAGSKTELGAVAQKSGLTDMFYREMYDTLCVASSSGQVMSFDGRTGEKLFSEESSGVRFLEGRRQNMYTSTATQISAWDTQNQRRCWDTDVPNTPNVEIQALALANDLDVLCIGTSEGLISMDTRTGAICATRPCDTGIHQLIYSPPMPPSTTP